MGELREAKGQKWLEVLGNASWRRCLGWTEAIGEREQGPESWPHGHRQVAAPAWALASSSVKCGW